MHQRNVVPLEEVVDVHLPVGLHRKFARRDVAHALQPERRAALAHAGKHLVERGRRGIERSEQQRTEAMHLHALQPDLRRIELLRAFHLHRAQELAAEIVGPAVIAAHQPLRLAAAVGDRTGAMAADVEEAADRAAVVREQQRLVAEPRREVVAGIRQLTRRGRRSATSARIRARALRSGVRDRCRNRPAASSCAAVYLFLGRRFLLLRARAGEDSGQRVVAFVAGVLVDLLARSRSSRPRR